MLDGCLLGRTPDAHSILSESEEEAEGERPMAAKKWPVEPLYLKLTGDHCTACLPISSFLSCQCHTATVAARASHHDVLNQLPY
jgi:hypothetical protein